ncbi:hypothetical protein L6452_13453 [Arctium lappa]|uniref:Uncharacterized protein n=1 Tax=Arctium lappa TaxID=4217 RepID=A0ACB9CIA8_ARCLA|nr:hypothetical protein L6452_13453 [Arctium lappa]
MDSSVDASSLFDADDNAFYEQLTRQILMLTDEDDDDDTGGMYRKAVIRKPVVHGYVGSKLQESIEYYSWSESGKCSVPNWMERLWAKGGGGGTGVFIPTVLRSGGRKSGRRRHNDKAKRNNDRGRTYSTVGQKIHG